MKGLIVIADVTRAVWDPFLYELQGKVWQVFPSEAVFLAEISGYTSDGPTGSVRRINRIDEVAGGRDTFSGRQVRHTIITAGLPGAGFVPETGTWNVPMILPSQEVHVKLTRALVPFSVTVDVERDSLNKSSAGTVETLTMQASGALARVENLAMLGDGTGLQATVTDAATSLTTTVTGANYDVLLPGTVWDIVTRSSGADPGQGLRRKIVSVAESTNIITWDTAQQASDGGSGPIVHAATEGIYIPGSWSNGTGTSAPGAKVMQGLEQALATTGTFEDLDKAANATWQGTDGRAGDATSLPLSDAMLEKAVRIARGRAGASAFDFGVGDPAAIDLYKQGKYAQVVYQPQFGQLKSGFTGIIVDAADKPFPLVKDFYAKKLGVRLIRTQDFIVYGDAPGPEFLEDDGGRFRRFSRTLAKEAEILDRVQLGVVSCNSIVKLDNLAVA